MQTCHDCKNQFVQPFKCITCGAEKLYDTTVKSQAAQIVKLTETRQHELAYVEKVLKACAKATASDIREELRDLRAWAANRSTCFPVDAEAE